MFLFKSRMNQTGGGQDLEIADILEMTMEQWNGSYSRQEETGKMSKISEQQGAEIWEIHK